MMKLETFCTVLKLFHALKQIDENMLFWYFEVECFRRLYNTYYITNRFSVIIISGTSYLSRIERGRNISNVCISYLE